MTELDLGFLSSRQSHETEVEIVELVFPALSLNFEAPAQSQAVQAQSPTGR